MLAELQPPDERNENYTYTARGAALDKVALLLASEVANALRASSPHLAGRLFELIQQTSRQRGDLNRLVDRWMNHAHAMRKAPFGGSDFVGPTAELHRLRKLFGHFEHSRPI